jgi:Cyclic nucleotide-binding domain/Major Facilitator Superfamily
MTGRAKARVADAAAACAQNVRSANLRRAQLAFGAMWAGEWGATVALGIVAFRDGGAAAVGLVGLLRMVPAAFIAPFAATIADRVRREVVLASVGVVRAVTLGAAAVVISMDGPVGVVYGTLVVATVAQTLYRPAHSALLPTLSQTPDELTSANVVRGLLDSVATLLGTLVAALLLDLSGPSSVFAAAAAASLASTALVARVRYEAPPRIGAGPATRVVRQTVEGLRVIVADRHLTLLTGLTTLQTFTRGALTVFSVVVAIDLLGIGDAGVGVLTAAVGAGAVAGSIGAALLVGGGRLARWFGIGVALWGAPLAGIGVIPREWAAIFLLGLVGVGNALVDVGAFTLPARLADDAVLARTFAAFEAIITLGVGAGAIATPPLIHLLGTRTALVVVGLAAPVAVLAAWRGLRSLDARVRVQDADIALLQRVPMLRPLPEATIEQLAAGLSRERLAAGSFVFTQGDSGDDFYVIEEGEVDVIGDGQLIGGLGPGEGFGEIALLRDCTRTASVRAATPLSLCAVSRDRFVAAVAGYSTSSATAEDVMARYGSIIRRG